MFQNEAPCQVPNRRHADASFGADGADAREDPTFEAGRWEVVRALDRLDRLLSPPGVRSDREVYVHF